MSFRRPQISGLGPHREGLVPRLEVGPGQIDLWVAACDEIDDEILLQEYRLIMDEAERRQELRFKFAHDRRRYVVTRALVRIALSRYESIAPQEWVFTCSSYGRPQIAIPPRGREWVQFNISHSAGLIAVGVTRERSIGIDVEDFTARSAPLELAGYNLYVRANQSNYRALIYV